ncbi:hypothetical protein I553_7605 [Mycobacterium xenopi 4042]|uniref:Uncharacterized protein n=1 Tax=Mycobacterium xenopi 4042 TaxID=1299334 RepID=X8AQW4_MYCXE|nr:hypothetical protein I553_7605 [Mycobacterium xenopi 4042]
MCITEKCLGQSLSGKFLHRADSSSVIVRWRVGGSLAALGSEWFPTRRQATKYVGDKHDWQDSSIDWTRGVAERATERSFEQFGAVIEIAWRTPYVVPSVDARSSGSRNYAFLLDRANGKSVSRRCPWQSVNLPCVPVAESSKNPWRSSQYPCDLNHDNFVIPQR